MRALIGQMVPMSDGVRLATDVWLPDGPGPFPVILVRTPYHRTGGNSLMYVDQGYVVVVPACRGKYDSEGVFTPLSDSAGRAARAGSRWSSFGRTSHAGSPWRATPSRGWSGLPGRRCRAARRSASASWIGSSPCR